MQPFTIAMSDDDDRTLVRPGRGHADPTSWNGISYDDMMRSLEDALPPSDRATLVGLPPTRPAFEPVPVTRRIPQPAKRPMTTTQPMARSQVTTVAPVALPSLALHYVDLDQDPDPDVVVAPPRDVPKKRASSRKTGYVIGAVAFVLAIGIVTWLHPETHARASATAGNARGFVDSWMSSASASHPEAPAAAGAPITAPVAPPVVAQPVATPPVVAEPVAVPTMRAPTAPPAQPAKAKAKARKIDADDDAKESKDAKDVDPDPSSLLDRGLGQ